MNAVSCAPLIAASGGSADLTSSHQSRFYDDYHEYGIVRTHSLPYAGRARLYFCANALSTEAPVRRSIDTVSRVMVLRKLIYFGLVMSLAACGGESPFGTSADPEAQAGIEGVPCQAGACEIISTSRALMSAIRMPDSASVPIGLGSLRLSGTGGESVSLSLAAAPAVLAAAGPKAALIVRYGGKDTTVSFEVLSSPVTLYTFDSPGVLTLDFFLARTIDSVVAGDFHLQLLTRAATATVDPLWAGRMPSNLSAAMPLAAAAVPSCRLTAQTGSCDSVTWAIDSWAGGGLGGDFQSNSGSGASSVITITFSKPISSITTHIFDPTYSGNTMTASGPDGEVGSAAFAFSGQPGQNQPDSATINGSITSVVLQPAAADYVSYTVFITPSHRRLEITCTPSPVVRGEVVTCRASLSTNEPFAITVAPVTLLPEGTAPSPEQSERQGMWRAVGDASYELSGPAARATRLIVDAAVDDGTLLGTRVVDTGSFSVTARSNFPSATFAGTPHIRRGSRSEFREPADGNMLLGVTDDPELDVRANGTGIHLIAIVGGPNEGFSFTSAPPAVLGLQARYSPSLDGHGFWAGDQNGVDNAGNMSRPSDTLRYCTSNDILVTLKQYVIAHEIGSAPAASHYTLFQQQLQYPMLKQIFEASVFETRANRASIVRQWEDLFDGFVATVRPEHGAFDNATTSLAATEAALQCALDFELGPEG